MNNMKIKMLEHNHRHADGALVALEIAGPLVQHLTERGLGNHFCWDEFRAEPNREFGILHLYGVVDSLPPMFRSEARKIVDLHLKVVAA